MMVLTFPRSWSFLRFFFHINILGDPIIISKEKATPQRNCCFFIKKKKKKKKLLLALRKIGSFIEVLIKRLNVTNEG